MNNWMPVMPDTAAEAQECETPDGVRRRIERLASNNPLVYQVFSASRALGWSGEDRYVMLAFNALVRLEVLERQAIDRLNCTVSMRPVSASK